MKRSILITGTSSGFGKEIADYLNSKGYNVVGTSRNPNTTAVAKYPTLKLDITEDNQVKDAVDRFIEMHGKIDVLINNAGYALAGPIEETSIHDAKEQFETNFFGLARMNKSVLPYMRSQKSGLIINMGSIGGSIGLPFQGYYSASKFAIEGYTEALRIELKPYSINVVNVNPGDFSTGFTAHRKVPEGYTSIYKDKFDTALKTIVKDEEGGSDPKEVAYLIEKLIRKKKSYRVRYFIGSWIQKFAVKLKKIVGSKTFEKLIMSTYKQD